MSRVRIDAVTAADWPDVRAIYMEGIASGNATFETDAPSWEQWDSNHLHVCRFVARDKNAVAEWAALSPVSQRRCYAGVAEVSVYVREAVRGQGVGRALLEHVVHASEAAGIWTLQGSTFPENLPSIRLQRSCGFRILGRRERVAQHHGVWRDTILTERRTGTTVSRDAPLSYLSPKTAVRPSAIHGRGLFARESITKGEVVAIKGGHVLHVATWREIEQRLGPAEISIAEGFVIAPVRDEDRDGSMIFTNHSCDPNIGVQGQIVFVAMRDIESGEELTHDWATTDDDTYEITCNCGAATCRGRITGQDWRRPDLRERYGGYMSWYLQRKIDQGR
jgi:L-amino acid N-acyltransferase YncA